MEFLAKSVDAVGHRGVLDDDEEEEVGVQPECQEQHVDRGKALGLGLLLHCRTGTQDPGSSSMMIHHHRCPIRHWPDDNHLVPKEETGSHIMSVEEEGGSHQLKGVTHPLPGGEDGRGNEDVFSQLWI